MDMTEMLRERNEMSKKMSDAENMKWLGIIFMVFAVWGVIQGIMAFSDPSVLGITAGQGQGILVFAVVVVLLVDAIEFYFGFIAYKGKPTKLAAIVCLIIGILIALGIVSTLFSGAFDIMSVLQQVGDAALAILYWWYYKKLHA